MAKTIKKEFEIWVTYGDETKAENIIGPLYVKAKTKKEALQKVKRIPKIQINELPNGDMD